MNEPSPPPTKWEVRIGARCKGTAPFAVANLRTKILDFRGFDSSRISILGCGIPRSIGNIPESLSQGILAGIILVGRLALPSGKHGKAPGTKEQLPLLSVIGAMYNTGSDSAGSERLDS